MNRNTNFTAPDWADALASGSLTSFETRQCATGVDTQLLPATPTDPDFIPRANPSLNTTPAQLFELIQRFAYNDGLTSAGTPRPACIQQPSVASIGEIPQVTQYLHVFQDNP